MSFSDSDWTRDPPLRPRLPPAQRRALLLTIAIAVSCMALALALYGIEQMVDASSHSDEHRRFIETAIAVPTGAGTATPPAAASASEAPPALAATPTATAASTAATEVDSRQLSALESEMRQRARETANQAAVESARRKERAWQRFYQRPDFCADNPTAAQMVQCANQHIRARKEFEERYAAGRL
jgi:type IV secretory pathway VirB10-like protein